eukprot:6179337-Pleurochrysis_carterae.AAC.2
MAGGRSHALTSLEWAMSPLKAMGVVRALAQALSHLRWSCCLRHFERARVEAGESATTCVALQLYTDAAEI